MKKAVKNIPLLIKLALLIWGTVYCMKCTDEVGNAVSGAVGRCLYTVIPSLYAMMIVSSLIVMSGAAAAAGKFTGKAGRVLFGMDKECFPVFLFSMFAGYPAGCKMLVALRSEGRLAKRRAELLSGICFGAGPAFISGCIAGRLYGSPAAGRILLISTVSANILTALGVSVLLRKMPESPSAKAPKIVLNSRLLTRCVSSAGRSMAEICFTIVTFAVFAGMLTNCGAVGAAGALLSSLSNQPPEVSEQLVLTFLDVTAAESLPHSNYTLLPWLSALVSFGGVCVLFQINAIISGKLDLLPLIIIRLAASALSFAVCRLIMPFMLQDETVPASAVSSAVHSAASPVPSIMLLMMTFALLRKTENKQG